MTVLTISWQRLVDSGETCPRCADTGTEVRRAADILSAALAPLGLAVHLDESVVTPEEFEQTPLESNRIFIEGRSLEDWLGGQVGHSPCCKVCGPNDCRTVTVDGVAHETIPADLIVRAGLLAAAGSLTQVESQPAPCCSPEMLPATIPVRATP